MNSLYKSFKKVGYLVKVRYSRQNSRAAAGDLNLEQPTDCLAAMLGGTSLGIFLFDFYWFQA